MAVVTGWFARAALPLLVGDATLDVDELLRRCGHRLWAEAHGWWWGQKVRPTT